MNNTFSMLLNGAAYLCNNKATYDYAGPKL